MASSTSVRSVEAPGPGFLSLRAPNLRRWFGNLGWPILLKELRADFRKSRFFVTHFMCILAIAIGVMVRIWFKRDAQNLTSVQMGRDLFDTFFLIQLVVVLIVFPTLTANAFTEERARKSLDLLITTDLRPGEVVLGKFLASSVYCLITVLATVPLLAISTLFGGVKIGEVFIAYAILIGHTLLIAMLGVFLSSCFTANLRSTLTVYTLVFAYVAVAAMSFGVEVWDLKETTDDKTLIALLLETVSEEAAEGAAGAAAGVQLLIGLILTIGFVFAFLFALTTNRIRTATDDKSSNLRILATLLLFLFLLGALFQPPPQASAPLDAIEQVDALLGWHVWVTLLVLFAAALVFPTEPLDLSRRIRRRFARLRGALAPLRVFTPGAFWGLLFVGVLLAASTGALLLHLESASGWIDAGTLGGSELDSWNEMLWRWHQVILTFPLFILAFAALGFYLASSGFSRGYCFLTVFFVFVIVLLLPMIFKFQKLPDGIFAFYYLSPFTLWDSLTPPDIPDEEGPRFVVLGGVPIVQFARVFYPALIGILVVWGTVLARKRRFPLVRLEA